MKKRETKLIVKDANGTLVQILPEVKTAQAVVAASDLPVSSGAVYSALANVVSSISEMAEDLGGKHIELMSAEPTAANTADFKSGQLIGWIQPYKWKFTVELDQVGILKVPFCLYDTESTAIQIDWGDGSSAETVSSSTAQQDVFPSHSYSAAGTYHVSVSSSDWESIYICRLSNLDLNSYKSSIVSVDSPLPPLAGMHSVEDEYTSWAHVDNVFEHLFYKCSSLISVPADLFRNIPNATSLQNCFSGCNALQSLPQNLLKGLDSLQNLSYFLSASDTPNYYSGSFNLVITAQNVTSAATFCPLVSQVSRAVTVPDNTATQETFDGIASACGLTVNLA